MKSNDRTIAVVGPLVTDYELLPAGSVAPGQTKVDVRITHRAGGGAANAARQVVRLGVPVQPIFLTGPESIDSQIAEEIEAAFGNAITLPCLKRSRMSIVLGSCCYGTRSAVAMPVLPEAAIDLLRDASATIIAPLMAADRAFVSGMLDIARNTILMLSADQLRDPAACLELMSRASVTVLNQGESHQLLGFAGEDVVRREFQMYGITAVVTSRHDATAYVGGRVVSRAAFQATARRTVGAGDVFVGTLAVGLVQGKPWGEILDDALAACCLLVESANITAAAMGDVQASRQRVVCEPVASRRAAVVRLLPAVSLGTAAAMALIMLAVG